MNTLRLSDAIRLGSLLRPQCFGFYHVGNGSCALGAAKDAIGQKDDGNELEVWPILREIAKLDCPVCGPAWRMGPDAWGGAIPHLNDDHKLSREAIADQVEIWEKALEPAEQAEEVVCATRA